MEESFSLDALPRCSFRPQRNMLSVCFVPDVLAVSLQIALGIGLPALVIRRDILRLGPEKLARAWNDASLWSAVVAFGPISLIVHFARTRRSLWGLLLGLGWAALVMALSGFIAGLGNTTV